MAGLALRYMIEKAASADEGILPDDVTDILEAMWSMCTTKHIKDGFQRLRVQEQRGQSSKTVSMERMWHSLVTQGVLNRVHKYNEISFRSVSHKRAFEELPRVPDRSTYRPWTSKPVLPVHQVSSTKREVFLWVIFRLLYKLNIFF